ncbi:MAG: hypothetical protein LBC09_01410 [Helicobacteraceae bacterium]|jgi:hypothetical protein|nr:hypothetical protein [Helicobacteraceae bacterium]
MKDFEAKKRLRFIKELEKFLSRASNYLGKTDAEWSGFCALAQSAPKMGDIRLYSPRYMELIRLANDLLARSNGEPIAVSDLASWLRGELNRYEKASRQRGYNRQKSRADLLDS